MQYELPVEEGKFKQLKETLNNTRSYCLFRLADGQHADTVFLLAHGTDTGLISINKQLVTAEQLLKSLIAKGIFKNKGIKMLYTICCHGGLQASVTIDGITVSSIHDSIEEIRCQAYSLMDDGYVLSIDV